MYMPAQLFQLITFTADVILFAFVGYYFLQFRAKEKKLEEREGKIDSEYHHIVDSALAKERKILDDASSEADKILGDATTEADKIITSVQYISQSTKETADQVLHKMVVDMQNISDATKANVKEALEKMAADLQKQATDTGGEFMNHHATLLKQLNDQSLHDFKIVTKGTQEDLQKSLNEFQNTVQQLQNDLQKQLKDFQETLLPTMEKEIEEYKQARMKQAEQTVSTVVKKVSQEVLNKSLSLDDHQDLVMKSLERATKEGIFE
jgi:F0F1-type ATP synthase membrane subunit b/b'